MSIPRHPEYQDSGDPWLGKIPSHWSVTRLKRVCRARASNVDKKAIEGEQQVQLCNYTDVYYNDVISADISFMPATAAEDQIAKFTLKGGDTIITKDSEAADDIARSAYVPQDLPGVVCGYHLSIIRPTERVCGAFIHRYFDTASVRAYFHVSANGLTRVGLGQYAVDNAPIAIPPLDEQMDIIAFVNEETKTIDRSVSMQKQMIDLLEEKQRAVIWQAVTKGLHADAQTKEVPPRWIGEIPSHWTTIPIRKVARLESGHTPSKSKPEYWVEAECTIPWFTLADINQVRDGRRIWVDETANKVSPLGIDNSSARVLPANTVFLSRTASVGFSGIMATDMAVSQDFAAWVCGRDLLSEYLLLCLRAMKAEFSRLMMGSTHKTIYMPDIEKLTIPLPPIQEQRQIVDQVLGMKRKTERLIERAEINIKLLQERRSALISAAVTGKINVRGYNEDKEREAA